MSLRIYLADLTHTGQGIATDTIPLNIGLVASYAIKKFGKDIDIKLFKYPKDLEEALKEAPPNILGLSNYTWNSNLSYYFTRLAKSLSPETLTLWGGTNYPFSLSKQEEFLLKRPDLDLHIFYEGEKAFTEVIERVLSAPSPLKVLNEPIGGCQYINPADQTVVSGGQLPRMKELDSIPSPYVSGLFDKFFDGKLVPMVETARGCPFLCNFCNAGDTYFNNVNKFSDSYVKEELNFIAQKIVETDIGHITFADNNFGMIPRDIHTAEIVRELQDKYSWPRTMTVWTGKNSRKRVISATRLLGKSLSISMSVQSMDTQVLKNIKRGNIQIGDFQAIAEELNEQGRPQHSEVIMPSPGESLKSHMESLNSLLDIGISSVYSHTMQMLHGTPYKDDESFIKKYGYKTKYRVVPQDFSEVNGDRIFDVEEVAVATKDMSFDEYVEARKYILIITLCKGFFDPLQRYLTQHDIKVSDWIENIYLNLNKLPSEAQSIVQAFVQETTNELWESEEELVAFFSKPENYQSLVDGERGSNVLFKHRVMMLSKIPREWASFVFKFTRELVCKNTKSTFHSQFGSELESLERFILAQVSECYTFSGIEKVIVERFNFDIPSWIKAGNNKLEKYSVSRPIEFKFFIDEEEKAILNDFYQRYGTSLSGVSKLIQRRPGGQPPLRSVATVSD